MKSNWIYCPILFDVFANLLLSRQGTYGGRLHMQFQLESSFNFMSNKLRQPVTKFKNVTVGIYKADEVVPLRIITSTNLKLIVLP